MGMPPSVDVGPLTYTVEASAEKIRNQRLDSHGGDLAYAWHNKQEIVVDPEIGQGLQRECVMHETLHAILRVSGLDLDIDEDESLVTKLSPWMLDTLRRNPALVAYLTEV